ncbi:MAG: hypothetical protein RMJ98_02410 [Myxococcales bacterium]|nr:hypothetical protein [Polyangiaceae bacterium]MDW8248142.1 hypothetical protein [Myxococcales bacterium]
MSGHSFGTNTTWAILGARYDRKKIEEFRAQPGKFSEPCAPEEIAVFEGDLSDPRVVAGVPVAGAPTDWFGVGLNEVRRPVQFQTATGDPVGADELWATVSLPHAGGLQRLRGRGGASAGEYPRTSPRPNIRTQRPTGEDRSSSQWQDIHLR